MQKRVLKNSKKRFGEKLESVPMICTDFNFNFAEDRNIPAIDFFNEASHLTVSNDRKLSTAKCKTTFLHDIFINSNQAFSFDILVTINLLYLS